MDTLTELSNVRTAIIRKEAEIESVAERIRELDEGDDLHRAKTKIRHEKERLVDLKCKCAELEVDAIRMGAGVVGVVNG
tara:strand:+ start:4786 stop:5022 length:237 start_codon:yes stop_codon:yes gene_type:complete